MGESDDELMARLGRGDMSAFDLIVQKYKTPLINFTYRFTGDQEIAEDLAQETFIRIYKNAGRYRSEMAGFRTWMYRIAANLCKNELRNRGRRSRILVNPAIGHQNSGSDLIEEVADASAGPDREMEEKELRSVLTQAISSLPEKLRTVLILRDIEDITYEGISRIIKRPVGTVKSRLNRARLMLRDKMTAYLHS